MMIVFESLVVSDSVTFDPHAIYSLISVVNFDVIMDFRVVEYHVSHILLCVGVCRPEILIVTTIQNGSHYSTANEVRWFEAAGS